MELVLFHAIESIQSLLHCQLKLYYIIGFAAATSNTIEVRSYTSKHSSILSCSLNPSLAARSPSVSGSWIGELHLGSPGMRCTTEELWLKTVCRKMERQSQSLQHFNRRVRDGCQLSHICYIGYGCDLQMAKLKCVTLSMCIIITR